MSDLQHALRLIRNWSIEQDDPDRVAKQAVVNDIGDAIEAEIRREKRGRVKTLGEAAATVMAALAKQTRRSN